MLNTNKSSNIRTAIATAIVGLVLSVAVLNGERNVSAVFVSDAVSAPVASSVADTSAAFDYFPSHFAAPTGEIKELPAQF
jgi:hypothetical protein